MNEKKETERIRWKIFAWTQTPKNIFAKVTSRLSQTLTDGCTIERKTKEGNKLLPPEYLQLWISLRDI